MDQKKIKGAVGGLLLCAALCLTGCQRNDAPVTDTTTADTTTMTTTATTTTTTTTTATTTTATTTTATTTTTTAPDAPVTTAGTTTATTPAVTEPPATPVADAALVAATFGELQELFFGTQTPEGDAAEPSEADAMALLDALVPYLRGEGTFSLGESYQLTDFTATDDSVLPQHIVKRDGVTVYQWQDATSGDYRETVIENERGNVTLVTRDGETLVDSMGLNDVGESGTSNMLHPCALSVDSMTDGAESGVWTLSTAYLKALFESMVGDAAMLSSFDGTPRGTLDAAAMEDDGELRLTAQLPGETSTLTLSLVYAGIGTATPHMEMSLGTDEAHALSLSALARDDELTAMRMAIANNGITILVEQVADGAHVDVSVRLLAAQELTWELTMSADMTAEQTFRGKLSMTMYTGQTTDPAPLSTATATPMVTRGEFEATMRGGSPDTLTLTASTVVGTQTTRLEVRLAGADAAVGATVLYHLQELQDTADAAANVRVLTEIRLVEGTVAQGVMQLTSSRTDAAGTADISARVTTPAVLTPTHSDWERELMARAARVLGDTDAYVAQAQQAIQWVSEGLNRGYTMFFPETFYRIDEDGDGIVMLISLLYDNGYYIYTDILLDRENYTYFYSGFDSQYDIREQAGVLRDRFRVHEAANVYDDVHYRGTGGCGAIAYFYHPELDMYVVFEMRNDDYGFMTEEPTAADFPGRVLHRITFDERGEVVRDMHDLTTTYDEQCYATQACACGYTLVSLEPMHHYTDEVVLSEQSGRQPRTALSRCTQCGERCVTMTDAVGHNIRVMLTPATQASITMENTWHHDPASWEHIGAGRDLTGCYLITDMIAEYDITQSFGCDLVLPDLRAQGITLLGIRFEDEHYRLSESADLRLVLPEGMEYIGCYGSTLFSQVREVVLPQTLRYISEGGLQGYVGETLVLPASLEAWGESGFHLMHVKSLTICGAYYETSPYLWCPELEELVLHGTFDVFRGFGTPCAITHFTVPDGVTVIAERAFERMSALQRVVLPASVQQIGNYAFRNCENLSDIQVPAHATVGEGVFEGCRLLP